MKTSQKLYIQLIKRPIGFLGALMALILLSPLFIGTMVLLFFANRILHSDYVMTYFHITDLLHRPFQLMDKKQFESYYKQPATLKNRTIRLMKSSCGTKGAFDKMRNIVKSFDFVNLEGADKTTDWNGSKTINL